MQRYAHVYLIINASIAHPLNTLTKQRQQQQDKFQSINNANEYLKKFDCDIKPRMGAHASSTSTPGGSGSWQQASNPYASSAKQDSQWDETMRKAQEAMRKQMEKERKQEQARRAKKKKEEAERRANPGLMLSWLLGRYADALAQADKSCGYAEHADKLANFNMDFDKRHTGEQ